MAEGKRFVERTFPAPPEAKQPECQSMIEDGRLDPPRRREDAKFFALTPLQIIRISSRLRAFAVQ